MSDLISRQAAISHVDDVPYIKEHPNVGLLWKAWIENLPSAQPTIEPSANCSEFPNNSDTISRQAAIDALDVLCQEHRYRIPGKRETYSQYNEAWQDALDRAEGAIGNLPSAQPEIIRCCDCIFKEIHGVDLYCDQITGEYIMVRPNDYCSWAERE